MQSRGGIIQHDDTGSQCEPMAKNLSTAKHRASRKRCDVWRLARGEPRAFEERYAEKLRTGLARWHSGRISELAFGSYLACDEHWQGADAQRANVDIIGIGPHDSSDEVTK
jgi:hypothetical protein